MYTGEVYEYEYYDEYYEEYVDLSYNVSEYTDEILEYQPTTGVWSLVDQMMSARRGHAVSVVSTEEISMYC